MTEADKRRAEAQALLAAAPALRLPLAPSRREAVLANLATAAEMAAILERAPLDPREPALAPVFRLPFPED